MKLSVKYLRTNEYTHNYDEVPEGSAYGFWRVVEHTGSGWFPWSTHYSSKEQAERRITKEEETER